MVSILNGLLGAVKFLFSDNGGMQSQSPLNSYDRNQQSSAQSDVSQVKSSNFINTGGNSDNFSSIRVPNLDTTEFKPTKISGDDVIRQLDSIHSDIVKYQNVLNKNIDTTFKYIKDVAKLQDRQISALSRDMFSLKKKTTELEEAQKKLDYKFRNFAGKHRYDTDEKTNTEKPRVRVAANSRVVPPVAPTASDAKTAATGAVVGGTISAVAGTIASGIAAAGIVGGATVLKKFGNEKMRSAIRGTLGINDPHEIIEPDPDIKKMFDDPKAKKEWDDASTFTKQELNAKAQFEREKRQGKYTPDTTFDQKNLIDDMNKRAEHDSTTFDERFNAAKDSLKSFTHPDTPSNWSNFLYNATGGYLGRSLADKPTETPADVPLPRPRPFIYERALPKLNLPSFDNKKSENYRRQRTRDKMLHSYASLSPAIYTDNEKDFDGTNEIIEHQKENVLSGVPNALSQQTSINIEEAKQTQLSYIDYKLKRQNITLDALQSIELNANEELTLKGRRINLKADEIIIDSPWVHSKGQISFKSGSGPSSEFGGGQSGEPSFPPDDIFGGDTSKNRNFGPSQYTSPERKSFGLDTTKFGSTEGLPPGIFVPGPAEGSSSSSMLRNKTGRVTSTADTSLPPEARGLLDTIAGGEARNYTEGNSSSSAYGRYQFLNGTWQDVSKSTGLAERSPINQDRNAWYLAQKTYKQQTGRELLTDLKDPQRHASILSTLKSQWPSLPGGSQHNGMTDSALSRLEENIKRNSEYSQPKITQLKTKPGEPESGLVANKSLFSPELTKIESFEGGSAASGGHPSEDILNQARDIALKGGPDAVQKFMTAHGYPRSGNWCGEFVASVIRSVGGQPPKDAAIASNWRKWGQPTVSPKPGDIAIRRGVSTGSTGSHVTIIDKIDPKTGKFIGLGGNQGSFLSQFPMDRYEFRTPGEIKNNVTNVKTKTNVPELDSSMFNGQTFDKFIEQQEKETKRIQDLQRKNTKPVESQPEIKPVPVEPEVPKEKKKNTDAPFQDARVVKTSHHPESVTPDAASPFGFTKKHWDADGIVI